MIVYVRATYDLSVVARKIHFLSGNLDMNSFFELAGL